MLWVWLMYSDFINEYINRYCSYSGNQESNFAIETSLSIPKGNMEEFLKCDLHNVILYIDVKTLNPRKYRKYTGKSIRPLIRNLKMLITLAKMSKSNMIIRVPKIDGFVNERDREATILKLRNMGFSNFDKFTYQVPQK